MHLSQPFRSRSRSGSPCDFDGLAVVETLELSKLLSVTLDEVRELVEEPRAFETGDILAPRGVERLASSRNGDIDVLRRPCPAGVLSDY